MPAPMPSSPAGATRMTPLLRAYATADRSAGLLIAMPGAPAVPVAPAAAGSSGRAITQAALPVADPIPSAVAGREPAAMARVGRRGAPPSPGHPAVRAL